MSVDYFLDTNVLGYSFDRKAPEKMAIASSLIEGALGKGCGAISWQVIQEFCNIAQRKFTIPMRPDECSLYLRKVLVPLCRVWPAQSLYLDALDLIEETGWSWCDCLIVAAALDVGAKRLYSEDLQHDRKVRRMEIVNPFVQA
jgi:predicted nucleic acid-binding protein